MVSNSMSYGYNSQNIEKMNLPPSIKCCRCYKVKGQSAFGSKYLYDLKKKISDNKGKFNPITSAAIPCTKCLPTQVVELKCGWCDITKVVDEFSGNERKKGTEEAKCKKCVDGLYEIEPDANDSDDSGSGGSVASSDDGGGGFDYDDDEANTLASYMGGTSLNGSNNFTSNPSSATGGGVPLNGATGSGAYTSRSASGTTTANGSTATVPGGPVRSASNIKRTLTPPHLRKKPVSFVAGSDTASVASSSRAPPSATSGFNNSVYGNATPRRGNAPSVTAANTNGGTSGNGKFAKVRAGVPHKVVFDAAKPKANASRKVDPEDDESLDNVRAKESDSDSD